MQKLQRHIDELRAGGLSVLLRKARSFAGRLRLKLGIFFAAPFVLVIVLLRPLVILRFGAIMSARIGHFIADVEAYLCVSEHTVPLRRTIDIIGCPQPACNAQLASMWSRTISIAPGGKFWKYLDQACRFWTRGERHHVKLYARQKDYGLFESTKVHLQFTQDEVQQGQILLRELGIPFGAPWICIHNRDQVYLDTVGDGRYAQHDYRNFSIESMALAAEELAQRGYYILRMGSVVAEKFISSNPKVIDYASSPLRSDFADIYLSAECVAYLGSDSGISAVPFVFRKPVYFVNFSATLIDLFLDQHIYHPFIVKRLWHTERHRFLSLREIFELGLADASETRLFEENGVEVISNTPEEIRDLALEIDERLCGKWKAHPGDEILQDRFWDIFRKCSRRTRAEKVPARVGAAFLRRHQDLLN